MTNLYNIILGDQIISYKMRKTMPDYTWFRIVNRLKNAPDDIMSRTIVKSIARYYIKALNETITIDEAVEFLLSNKE